LRDVQRACLEMIEPRFGGAFLLPAARQHSLRVSCISFEEIDAANADHALAVDKLRVQA
jgi:hypothetical protein